MNAKLKTLTLNASMAGSLVACALALGGVMGMGGHHAAEGLADRSEETVMVATADASGERSDASGPEHSGTVRRANLLVGEQVVDRLMSMGVDW